MRGKGLRPPVTGLPAAIERGAKIAFAQLRFWPQGLKDQLRESGLWEDVQQHCYMTAVEIAVLGLTDIREASRFAQRELYAFLKAYGFRRERSGGYRRPDWNEPGSDPSIERSAEDEDILF